MMASDKFTLGFCRWSNYSSCGSIEVSGELTTYPTPKSTLTPTSHLGQNCDLGEG